MNTTNKIALIISVIISFPVLLSCDGKTDILIDSAELSALKSPTLKIYDVTGTSATVEVTLPASSSFLGTLDLIYYKVGDNKGMQVDYYSQNGNTYLFELKGLTPDTEYDIYPGSKYESFLAYIVNGVYIQINPFYPNKENIVKTLGLHNYYKSPIAYKDRFETGWTTIDRDGNGETWETYEDSGTINWGGVGYCARCYSNNSDDWLISAPVHLDADTEYEISYAYYTSSYYSSYPVYMDIYVSTSSNPDVILMNNAINDGKYYGTSFKNTTHSLKVDKSGEYYICFNYRSGTSAYRMYLTGFEIKKWQ